MGDIPSRELRSRRSSRMPGQRRVVSFSVISPRTLNGTLGCYGEQVASPAVR